MNMKRIIKTTYISGPITGWPAEEVIEKFEHAEQLIRDRGEVPVNPLKLCNLNMTYEECMRKDITIMLMQADKIYMITGYENSDGAELELEVAEMCGLEVEYEKEPSDE